MTLPRLTIHTALLLTLLGVSSIPASGHPHPGTQVAEPRVATAAEPRTGDEPVSASSARRQPVTLSPDDPDAVPADTLQPAAADMLRAGTTQPASHADSASQTPVPDSLSLASSSDPVTARPNFLKRFIAYFADANKNKRRKKFDFSIIGGPHYSDDTKLGLGIVAAGLYNIKGDTLIPPSNVSLFGDVTTSGFYLLGIRGNNLFPGDRFRLNYTLYFYSFPGYIWGVGYDAGNVESNATRFTRKQNQFKIDFLIRLARNTYIGPTASFDLIIGKNFHRPEVLRGAAERTINGGFGASFVYDSRDVLTNAYRGAYVKLEQKFYPGFASSRYSFMRTELQADVYKRVWKDCILAVDLYSMLNYGGDVPWTLMSTLGGSSRMRGYYDGQFRDEKSITLQAELRQRVWRRIGVAAWVGAGNVFPSFRRFNWSHTLPNYGIGARWEFKRRVNVRLDYGFGKKGHSAFMFNINEAF